MSSPPPPPKTRQIVRSPPPPPPVRKKSDDLAFLGIVATDIDEYHRKYSDELKDLSDLPEFARTLEIDALLSRNTPVAAAASSSNDVCPLPKLVGDVEWLKLIDLDKEGLSEYRE